jgi:hypothetical protein
MKLYEQQQTEALFMAQVTDYAQLRGWEYMHILPGLNERGRYRTPVSGSLGPGWPDLILVRGTRILAVELKSEKGRLTSFQADVLETLSLTGIPCHVWKPSDWPYIEETLR